MNKYIKSIKNFWHKISMKKVGNNEVPTEFDLWLDSNKHDSELMKSLFDSEIRRIERHSLETTQMWMTYRETYRTSRIFTINIMLGLTVQCILIENFNIPLEFIFGTLIVGLSILFTQLEYKYRLDEVIY